MSNTYRMNDADRALAWKMWHEGHSHHRISRAVKCKPPSVFLFFEKHGGIEPPARARALIALTPEEREEISRGLRAGDSMRQIARDLGRSPSTVSREIKRNEGVKRYRAARADQCAWQRAQRPRTCRLASCERLQKIVSDRLREAWSPQQIAGWLKETFPDEPELHVSHETIYQSLFIQSRGALKKELRDHLRTKRRFRQSRYKTNKGHSGSIVDPIRIRDRPAEIEDRAVPGHWEGDLIEGFKGTYVATLVERKTRFVLLVRVTSKETLAVVPALVKQMQRLPKLLQGTLTWDRGSELARHKDFAMATDMKVYFCDPGSPWQRGSNENTNGLLRQYLPKGSDLSYHTQAELNMVARKLNERPRKTLGFKTPAYMLEQELKAQGVAPTG